MSDVRGLIDAHVHAGPEHVPRRFDYLELAKEARHAGMAGIIIKSHTSMTADRAQIAQKNTRGISVWGGLVLNRWCGGLNPAAVENAIGYGAAVIWLPTLDAANDPQYHRSTLPGIHVTACQDLHDILSLISKHDVILATGHCSVEEIQLVTRLAREHGVKKIIITHVEAPFIGMDLNTQLQLATQGCMLERTWVFTTAVLGRRLSPQAVVQGIKDVGVESTILATDMGQADNPSPIEGYCEYVTACQQGGFNDSHIRRMAFENVRAWLP